MAKATEGDPLQRFRGESPSRTRTCKGERWMGGLPPSMSEPPPPSPTSLLVNPRGGESDAPASLSEAGQGRGSGRRLYTSSKVSVPSLRGGTALPFAILSKERPGE